MVDQKPKTETKGSRRERRLGVTHQKLMNAAGAVFAEKGLDLTRIDDITERADVGKGTFYHHFKSKDDLIRELIKGMLGDLVAVIERRCKGITDLRGLLDTLIETHIDFFCKRWEDFVLYFQGRTDLTLQNSYAGIQTPFIEYLEHMEALLASVIQYRLPRPVLRRIACAVAGLVSGYYSFAVLSCEEEDIDATFSSLKGAMVASLARFIQEAAPAPEGSENVREGR